MKLSKEQQFAVRCAYADLAGFLHDSLDEDEADRLRNTLHDLQKAFPITLDPCPDLALLNKGDDE